MTTGFDPTDPALAADPHGLYRRLRDEAPALRTEIGGGTWVVTRYDDVKRLVRDNDGRMQPPGFAGPPELAGGPAERIYRGLMVLNDPPVHSRLRTLAEVALTKRAVEGLRADVERVVDETLDAVLAREGETIDAVADLAFVVPLRVICGMLGIPEEDRLAFLKRTPDFFRLFLPSAQDVAGIAACHEACAWFMDYLGEEIARRRADPDAAHDDIFTALVRAEADGDRLSADELVATVLSLLTGGFDTTMGTLAAGIQALAEHPGQLALLREAPAARARAMTEEALRLESPVQITFRHLPQDTAVAGATIPAGETIWLVLASANRDERRFPSPDALDLARGDDKHVAFGGSRHFCIGNHLARLELDTTFRRLGERVAAIELAGDAPRRPNLQFRSLERLPVHLAAA